MSKTKSELFPIVEPWPHPVIGIEIANDVRDLINNHIICDQHSAVASTLWIMHTWLIDSFTVSPIANITAPMPNCGKSTLLELMTLLVKRPLKVDNISPAAVFRTVDRYNPTLLIDEVDSFVNGNEELRGILNSGHRRDGRVIRVDGNSFEPTPFATYCAKVLCGIGSMANTLESRSIKIELRRKLPHEEVSPMRHIDKVRTANLAAMLSRFAVDNEDAASVHRPNMTDGLCNRTLDNWEPMLTIAELIGGAWPALAREASLAIESKSNAIDITTELLRDTRIAFQLADAISITTYDLIERLCEMDESPWKYFNKSKPITDRQLAKQLKDFKISSADLRIGHEVRKGYKLTDFNDSFLRYLPALTQ
jgi:hypothetical protein